MRHAILTCKNHPNLRWNCKEIAVSPTGNGGLGSYNGCRNIFYSSWPAECACSASDLILAPEDSRVFENQSGAWR
jgi:hypothetical protein